jgi:hypothetical protein
MAFDTQCTALYLPDNLTDRHTLLPSSCSYQRLGRDLDASITRIRLLEESTLKSAQAATAKHPVRIQRGLTFETFCLKSHSEIDRLAYRHLGSFVFGDVFPSGVRKPGYLPVRRNGPFDEWPAGNSWVKDCNSSIIFAFFSFFHFQSSILVHSSASANQR